MKNIHYTTASMSPFSDIKDALWLVQASAEDIEPLIREYLDMFKAEFGPLPKPRIQIKNNFGSRWLGRTVGKPYDTTTTMQFQQKILDDEETLERIVAHEMIHHVDFLVNKDKAFNPFLRKMSGGGHGSFFQKLASFVNSRKGAGFVTEKSDESYVVHEEERLITVLIAPMANGGFGYQWALKPSAKQKDFIEKYTEPGFTEYIENLRKLQPRAADFWKMGPARLFGTKDSRFSAGIRLGSHSWAIPRDADMRELLRKMYESAS